MERRYIKRLMLEKQCWISIWMSWIYILEAVFPLKKPLLLQNHSEDKTKNIKS